MILIYYVSEKYHDYATVIDTPVGKRWIRVEGYRGGGDPLEYAQRNAKDGEAVLNTIDETSADDAKADENPAHRDNWRDLWV